MTTQVGVARGFRFFKLEIQGPKPQSRNPGAEPRRLRSGLWCGAGLGIPVPLGHLLAHHAEEVVARPLRQIFEPHPFAAVVG